VSLIIALDRLAAIMQRENAALTALDFAAATGLLDEKQVAIEAFEPAGRNAPSFPPLDAVAGLRAAALVNAGLIERAIAVQRRVIETVLAAARKRDAAPRYQADAGMARARRPAPMTLLARV